MGDGSRSPAANLPGCIGRVKSGGCIGICDKLMENSKQSEGLTASLPSLPLKIGLKKSQKEGSFPSNHPSSGTVLVLGSSFCVAEGMIM